MPFDWNSGQPASVGGFDWDLGEPIAPPNTLAPPAIKPYRVPMAETNDGYLVRGLEKLTGAYKPPMSAGPGASTPSGKPVDPINWEEPMLPDIQIAKAGPTSGKLEQGLRGAGRSLVNNARALSTPQNVAIMGGLAAANVAQAFVPPIIPAVQALNATAAVKFGSDMIGALPEQNAAYQEAVKRGDFEGAVQALTDVGVTATMAAGLARGAMEQARPAVESKMGMEPTRVVKAPELTTPMADRYANQEFRVDDAVTKFDPAPPKPKSAQGSAQVFLRDQKRETSVPTEGIPENVARRQAALEDVAIQTIDKPWSAATEVERAAIRELVDEGYIGAGAPPPFTPEIPLAPKSAAESASVFADQVRPTGRPVPGAPVPVPVKVDAKSVRRDQMAQAVAGKDYAALEPREKVLVDYGLAETEGQKPFAPEVSTPVNEPMVTKRENLIQPPGFTLDAAKVEALPLPLEAGVLRVPQFAKPKPPLAPEEAHFSQMLKEREAKRGSGIARGMAAFHEKVAKLKSETVDSLSPILDAVDNATKQYGYTLRPTQRFEYWADRALGAREMSERFMRDNGLLDVIKAPEGRKEFDYFDQFLIANEAIKEAQRGPRKTGRDVTADQAAVAAFESRVIDKQSGMTYGDLAKRFYEYNDKLLDYSVNNGLIAKETAAEWRKTYGNEHVPLKRVFDAIESATQEHPIQGAQIASLGKQTVYFERKGSERPIDNPMYELMDRTRRAVSQGERNNAARVLAGYADLPGLKDLIREVNPSKGMPKNHFSYLDNGKRRVFETTPEIEAAAKSLDARNLGVLAQVLAVPARVKRFFTTGVNTSFAAANVLVDPFTTAVTSKNTYQTTVNPKTLAKAFFAAVKHDDLWAKIESHGAGFTQLDIYRNTREHTIDAIRAGKNTKERGKYIAAHPVRSLVELARAAEDIVSRSEQVGRARLYEGTRKASEAEGYRPADAEILGAIASNNELPNYRRSGNLTRALSGAFLYLNASIQGSRNVMRSIEQRPVETFGKMAATIAMPTIMLTLYNLMDPERKKIYDDIRQYEKDNNLILVTPGAKLNPKTNKYEGIIKLKMDPGMGRMSIPLRRVIETAYGADKQTLLEIAQNVVGTVLPFEPTVKGVASALTPPIAGPSAQAMSNYDFFRGGPKVPRNLQDLPVEQQVLPNTSGTAKKVAGALGVSPIKTEEFFKDTIGGASPQILRGLDTAAAWAGVITKDDIGGESTPSSIGARFTEARAGETKQREYEALDKIRDKAVNNAIAAISKLPAYQQITDEKQRLEINRKVAASVMAQINGATVSNKAWDGAQPAQRMQVLRKIDAMVGGKPALRQSVPFIK